MWRLLPQHQRLLLRRLCHRHLQHQLPGCHLHWYHLQPCRLQQHHYHPLPCLHLMTCHRKQKQLQLSQRRQLRHLLQNQQPQLHLLQNQPLQQALRLLQDHHQPEHRQVELRQALRLQVGHHPAALHLTRKPWRSQRNPRLQVPNLIRQGVHGAML